LNNITVNAVTATNATNAGGLTGNPSISVSSINTNNNNINAGNGTITAATFSGALSGNATGLSNTPSIIVNAISANSITIGGSSVYATPTYVEIWTQDHNYTSEADGVRSFHIWANSTYNKYIEFFVNKQLISVATLYKNNSFTNHWSYSDSFNYLLLEVGGNYAKWWIYRYSGRIIAKITYYV
jgi:hypothetical protein